MARDARALRGKSLGCRELWEVIANVHWKEMLEVHIRKWDMGWDMTRRLEDFNDTQDTNIKNTKYRRSVVHFSAPTTPFYAPFIHLYSYTQVFLDFVQRLYTAAIIHLPHIHQFLPPSPCYLIWNPLFHQCCVCCLHCVHLVSRSRNLGCKVLNTGSASKFKD